MKIRSERKVKAWLTKRIARSMRLRRMRMQIWRRGNETK